MNSVEDRLVGALHLHDVVIVAGTGVSAAISDCRTAGSWKALLEDGIYALSEFDIDEANSLDERLSRAKDSTKLAQIADSIRTGMNGSFDRWFSHATEAHPDRPELARALGRLNAPILTTNYDTLLEDALGRGSASWTDSNAMLEVVKGASNAIGHMHGVRSDPTNAIFSHSDYLRIRESLAAQNIQLGAFTLKSFLFVGAGGTLSDGNFGPMADKFEETFFTSAATHYRLCRNSEVNPQSQYTSVIDVGYGDSYEDLVPYLNALAKRLETPQQISHQTKALVDIARTAQESFLVPLRMDDATPSLQTFTVPPVLLPITQDEFSNLSAREPAEKKPKRLELDDIVNEGATVLLAGDPSSGVSTALAWAATAASEKFNAYPIRIDRPFTKGSRTPIAFEIERSRRDRDLDIDTEPFDVLCVDNLAATNTSRFDNVVRDIARTKATMRLIGVTERDALAVSSALQEAGVEDVRIVYIGRFGREETVALAELLTDGDAEDLAQTALSTVLQNSLPRTPFTLAILIELLNRGVTPSEGDSESWLLSKYIDHLLQNEYFASDHPDELTVQNKRALMMVVASHFVREMRDEASESDVESWIQQAVNEYAWPYSARRIIEDLVRRHVLFRTADDRIRFRRSAYLELMAGEHANRDSDFRAYILGAPMQLAPIICSYAAHNRSDSEALEVVERQIERIDFTPVTASSFAPVRQVPAREEISEEATETEDVQHSDDSRNIVGDSHLDEFYDLPSDVDPPAFSSVGFDELSPARQAMSIVDFASRVLRDSDQLRDQALKQRVMGKLLIAWVKFIDQFEKELSELPDEVFNHDFEVDRGKWRDFIVKAAPLFLSSSGLQTCLASPRVEILLQRVDISDELLGEQGSLVRALALMNLETSSWVAALSDLSDEAVRTFFSAYFLSALAQQEFIENESLSDTDRLHVLAFIRRCADARITFSGTDQRNHTLNQIEDRLRTSRTRWKAKGQHLARLAG